MPLSQTVAGHLPCVAASEMSTQIIRGKVVPYTKYRNTSSFVREGIDLLLKREDEQPSGWSEVARLH